MKKLKCLLFVAVVALAFAGCRKPVEVSFAENAKEIAAAGETFEVGLKSNGEWTVTTSVDWVSVAPSSGSGDATLTVMVQSNLTSESRTAEIKAVTKDHSDLLNLTQAMEGFITVAPTSIFCGDDGGEFNVEIVSNIAWSVSEVPSWISLSEISGTGNKTVVMTVLSVSGDFSVARSADLLFGNEEMQATLSVTQAPEPQIPITVTPRSLQMACEGETKTVDVACAGEWEALITEEWVTVDKGEGVGDMSVAITVSENPVYEPRRTTVSFRSSTGTIAIVSIAQDASPDPHFLEVSPTSLNFSSEGGEETISIACDALWKADVNENWLSFSETIGTGNATITLTASANGVHESRTAMVVIASDNLERVITVSQEAGNDEMFVSFSPDTLYVSYTGASQTFSLTSNTSWMLESSSVVVFLSPMAGNGNATINTIIDVNSSEEPRTGYIRANHHGQMLGELVIVQEGKPDLLEANITNISAPAEGGEFVIHVTSNQGWRVSVSDQWITAAPVEGFGNGDVTVVVKPLNSQRPRTGTITLKADSGKIVVIEVKQQP